LVGGGSEAATAAARARERASELAARRIQMTEQDAPTPARLEQARRTLLAALVGAAEATERAAAARRRAALAHDRAATLHQRLAERGVGDVRWHRREADRHRRAAETDQASAIGESMASCGH
jgi:hypothetical protein